MHQGFAGALRLPDLGYSIIAGLNDGQAVWTVPEALVRGEEAFFIL